uniref:DUF4371 domain-containing protein n=1 Tax=Schizaphis graminum TaxID=13262 RepID=A0A2S2NQM4_SCHGA
MELVDRLAVLVSGNGILKLLVVPPLLKSTDKLMAEAVYNLINNWNLSNHIQFMCFDTTARNTGQKSGARVLLEKMLGQNLIKLASRHHIFEIVVGKVFDHLMGPSNGPDIALFKKISNLWPNIIQDAFENSLINTCF